MTVFKKEDIAVFRFVRCGFDPTTGVASLVYAFDNGEELTETVTFPGAPFDLNSTQVFALQKSLQLLHLIAGISYYKAAIPPTIYIENYSINSKMAELLNTIYLKGLGEFAYRNTLNLKGRINFPSSENDSFYIEKNAGNNNFLASDNFSDNNLSERNNLSASDNLSARNKFSETHNLSESHLFSEKNNLSDNDNLSASNNLSARNNHSDDDTFSQNKTPLYAEKLHLKHHALVAIGGGKDSLVSIEALRKANISQTVTWIGGSQLIAACAARTELPVSNIQRSLAPQLFEINRQGAWNGHIPVTAINSAIFVVAAILNNANQIVFSNEYSASIGSKIEGTGEVNHQWSKGWEFEALFSNYIQTYIAEDLHYYSLLRPFSELAIARQFTKNNHYDHHFSSCNRNFHLLGDRPVNRWCGVCPKCHFVFLALAPFISKPRLMAIFGRNLLDDASQAEGFDALLEFNQHKPFECVGEGRESRAAMFLLSERPEWKEDVLINRFIRYIKPHLSAEEITLEPLLTAHLTHHIPAELWESLRADFAV